MRHVKTDVTSLPPHPYVDAGSGLIECADAEHLVIMSAAQGLIQWNHLAYQFYIACSRRCYALLSLLFTHTMHSPHLCSPTIWLLLVSSFPQLCSSIGSARAYVAVLYLCGGTLLRLLDHAKIRGVRPVTTVTSLLLPMSLSSGC